MSELRFAIDVGERERIKACFVKGVTAVKFFSIPTCTHSADLHCSGGICLSGGQPHITSDHQVSRKRQKGSGSETVVESMGWWFVA